jgi:hypothetical protein
LVERAPGSGARDGFFGASADSECVPVINGRAGAGAVVTVAGMRGAGVVLGFE